MPSYNILRARCFAGESWGGLRRWEGSVGRNIIGLLALESEQITRAFHPALQTRTIESIKPARRKLAVALSCPDRKLTNPAKRLDYFWPDGVNNGGYACHLPPMTNFLSCGKTNE